MPEDLHEYSMLLSRIEKLEQKYLMNEQMIAHMVADIKKFQAWFRGEIEAQIHD